MGKESLSEQITLQNKTLTSKKSGRTYEAIVVISDNPINVNSEIGKILRRLGFLWTPNNQFMKFKNKVTPQDIAQIEQINASMGNQENPQSLREYITIDGPINFTSKTSGKVYPAWIAKSDVPNELTQKSVIGFKLKRLGFIWNGKNWQYFDNRIGDEIVNAIKKINDELSSNGSEQVAQIDDMHAQLEEIRQAIRDSKIPLQTKTQLDSDLEKFIQQIANATDQQADAIFNQYLSFSHRQFHEYSDANKLLMFAQRPDASKVASEKRWKSFGRNVPNPKETVITINCGNKMYVTNPQEIPKNQKKAEYTLDQQNQDAEYEYKLRNGWIQPNPRYEKEMRLRKTWVNYPMEFASCAVFDISDTVIFDEELANKSMETQGSWVGQINTHNDNSAIANKVFEIAKKSLIANGIQVTQNPATAKEASWSRRGQINVSSDVTGTYAVSTILKEWAGDLLHQEGGQFYSKSKKYLEDKGDLTPAHILQIERVQESTVAAAICKHLRLPTTEHPTYMALLKAQDGLDSGQLIRENITTIAAVSNYIIRELQKYEGELNAVAGEGEAQPNAQQGAEVPQGAAATQPQQ